MGDDDIESQAHRSVSTVLAGEQHTRSIGKLAATFTPTSTQHCSIVALAQTDLFYPFIFDLTLSILSCCMYYFLLFCSWFVFFPAFSYCITRFMFVRSNNDRWYSWNERNANLAWWNGAKARHHRGHRILRRCVGSRMVGPPTNMPSQNHKSNSAFFTEPAMERNSDIEPGTAVSFN